jgi:SAM-dependent methyltransferase
MAADYADVPVLHQDFLALDLPDAEFDGVFANASLFHVPMGELGRVLAELWACLKPGGVLFASNPRGKNEQGWNRGRFGAYHDFDRWREFATGAGFEAIRHYYRPEGLPRDQQPWLASLWRRPQV